MALVGAFNAPFLYAGTPVSVEFGYLNTSSDSYGSGFVWGATIRGDQRLTFGVAARFYETSVEIESEANPGTTYAEDKYRIFSLSPYAYLDLFKGKPDNQLLVAAGPQVHFVNASRSILIASTSIGARETRLGFGGLIRYERRIRMFQEMFFVAEAYYSYMEGTFEKVDNYQPPLESINLVGIVMGLGYPL
jgi:hypothetical protein